MKKEINKHILGTFIHDTENCDLNNSREVSPSKSHSEDNILIFVTSRQQIVAGIVRNSFAQREISLSLLQQHLPLNLPLLISLNLLQPEEILPLELIQLPLDVTNRILQPRLHHILQSVNPTIRGLDSLIESEERGLKRGQLDENLDGLDVGGAALLHLLAAPRQSGEVVLVGVGVGGVLELGELDTGNVFLARADAEGGFPDVLEDDVLDIVAGDVLGLGEREGGGFHDIAHGLLGGDDLLQDLAELHRERVALLLEERMAARGSDQTRLHHSQHRHGGDHVQTLRLPRHLAFQPTQDLIDEHAREFA